MSFSFRPKTLLTLAATLALSLPALAQQASVRLPSLGSAADTVISPQQASMYGAEFLRQLRAAHLVLDDPQVDQYLHELGYRLAAASPDPTQHYTFTLLDIPQINSFATFGGYIFIFSKMFTVTQSQSELAAVMAHELAHISQHHLQRALAEQEKTKPLYILGAFAAALAASQADNSDRRRGAIHPYGYGYGYGYGSPYDAGIDPAMGAFYSVMALMRQHQIDFTRADEAEADHIGIQTLAKAGFNPEGMANVFAHMQALIRPGGNGGMAAGNLPGFLQNHPVSSVRIADARARAHVLEKQMHSIKVCVSVQTDLPHCTEQQWQSRQTANAGDPPIPGLLPLPFVKDGIVPASAFAQGPSEQQYKLMRERVRVLSSGNPRSVVDYYSSNMAASKEFAHATSNRYGYALALVRAGKASQSVPIMAKLVKADPGNLTLALGLADAERHAGQRQQALHRYASLNAMWPNDPAIVLDYSRALLDSGAKADAKTAQGLLKPLLNDNSEPSLYETYGHACHVAGDEIHAGIAYADATFLSGHAIAALDQLQRLLQHKNLDYYTRAQIKSRIALITPIVLEIHRRHLDRNSSYQFGNTFRALRPGICVGKTCTQP